MNPTDKITQDYEDYYQAIANIAEDLAEQIRNQGMRDRPHGPVVAAIEHLKAQLPRSEKTAKDADASVQAAIKQLRRSERGADALESFTAFLSANERSALGLDSGNWGALVDLVKACQLWGAYNVLPMLPSPSRPAASTRQDPLLPEEY